MLVLCFALLAGYFFEGFELPLVELMSSLVRVVVEKLLELVLGCFCGFFLLESGRDGF